MPADLRVLSAGGLVGERDAAQPLLTLRAPEGRVELSTATVANWAAKNANLLVDGYGSPQAVGLLLPLHWQTVCLLLGAVAAGAEVVVGGTADDVAGCDLVLCTAVLADGLPDGLSGVPDVVVVSTHPLGAPGAVPAGLGDHAREAPSYGDLWSGPRVAPQVVAGGAAVVVADLDLGPLDRVVVAVDPASPGGLGLLLGALRSGAALVLVPQPDAVDLAAVAAEEGVTAAVGTDVPGARRLG